MLRLDILITERRNYRVRLDMCGTPIPPNAKITTVPALKGSKLWSNGGPPRVVQAPIVNTTKDPCLQGTPFWYQWLQQEGDPIYNGSPTTLMPSDYPCAPALPVPSGKLTLLQAQSTNVSYTVNNGVVEFISTHGMREKYQNDEMWPSQWSWSFNYLNSDGATIEIAKGQIIVAFAPPRVQPPKPVEPPNPPKACSSKVEPVL